MDNLEKVIRLIISKNEPLPTIKVLTKIAIPTTGKVFIHCIYVINNISAFSLTIQSDNIKQRVGDEWGEELSKKIEKSLGVEVGYFKNTVISEKQYKEKIETLNEKGFYWIISTSCEKGLVPTNNTGRLGFKYFFIVS